MPEQVSCSWGESMVVFHSSIAKPRISALKLLNLEREKPKAAAEMRGLAHPALTAQNLKTKTLHAGQPRLCKVTAVDTGLFLALTPFSVVLSPGTPCSSLHSLHQLPCAPYTPFHTFMKVTLGAHRWISSGHYIKPTLTTVWKLLQLSDASWFRLGSASQKSFPEISLIRSLRTKQKKCEESLPAL